MTLPSSRPLGGCDERGRAGDRSLGRWARCRKLDAARVPHRRFGPRAGSRRRRRGQSGFGGTRERAAEGGGPSGRDRRREPDALEPTDIPAGGPPVLAWPMDPAGNLVRKGSRLNKVLLVRLDPTTLVGVTQERAAEGVVAYSAICPHAGCEVNVWGAEQQILECSCHYLALQSARGCYGDRWPGATRACRRCRSSSWTASSRWRSRSPAASASFRLEPPRRAPRNDNRDVDEDDQRKQATRRDINSSCYESSREETS